MVLLFQQNDIPAQTGRVSRIHGNGTETGSGNGSDQLEMPDNGIASDS